MATPAVPAFQKRSGASTLPFGPILRQRPRLVRSKRSKAPSEGKAVQNKPELLAEMLPLVQRVAFNIRKHLPAHIEVDELAANGVLGLVDAVAKFDPSKGVKLETYARHRVRGAILDGLRRADAASRDLRRKNKRIQTLYHELESKLGRPVRDEEMAKALGINLGQWHQSLNEIQNVGIDWGSRILSAGPTLKLQSSDVELLADGRDNPFDFCYRREQHEILDHALSRLRDCEREIITLHDQHGLTMKQIAVRMHVDASRVSQIHSVALGRLKASVDSVLNPRQAEVSKSPTLSMAAGAGG
ncbi:MAG: sigma-70 family RNA polymerase sigma factor [Terriglobia bacterium]